MLTQADIEERIIETVDALDELTHEFAEIGRTAALAEVEYRRNKAMMTLAVIQQPSGKPISAKERDARIDLASIESKESHEVTAAALEATREALRTHRTRLDSLRTLAANVRAQT